MMSSIIMITTNAAIAMSHIGDMDIFPLTTAKPKLLLAVGIDAFDTQESSATSAETTAGLATIRHDAVRKTKTSSRAALFLMFIPFYWAAFVIKAFL